MDTGVGGVGGGLVAVLSAATAALRTCRAGCTG